MHLCTELTAAFWTLEPFGEIGANFSLQLSSRTRLDKINKKKVIAENQCEKHKKSSLVRTRILQHQIRISGILFWDRKPYLTHVTLPRLSHESCTLVVLEQAT